MTLDAPTWMQRARRTGAGLPRRLGRSAAVAFAPWLARLLAPRPALGWQPDGRFGSGEVDPGLGVRMRLALWRLWERRAVSSPLWIRSYGGVRLRSALGTDLTRCLYVSGAYEPNELTLLGRLLGPGMHFVDVGANEGVYTLLAARRVGPQGGVVALEPSSREFDRLVRNVQANRMRNVVALRLAASERSGFGELTIAEAGHAGQNTLGRFAYEVTAVGRERVELLPLDRLSERCLLPSLDAMKIDVEGSELAVLRGARELLRRYHPVLLIELVEASLWAQGASREALLSELRALGYRFWMFGDGGRPVPVEEIEADGINFVASHPSRPVAVLRSA